MLNEDPDLVKKILNLGLSPRSTKSKYDKTRDTVGKIYRDAQISKHEDSIEVGDLSRELTKSLIEDINDALRQFDKKGKPYYLMIHEKKDLQMKRAFLRRMLYFGYRPYPEDDTVVFRRDPVKHTLFFCWALPHWSEMDNVLANPKQYREDYVHQIKSWKAVDLKPFGFMWDEKEKWIPNPKWVDQPVEKVKPL